MHEMLLFGPRRSLNLVADFFVQQERIFIFEKKSTLEGLFDQKKPSTFSLKDLKKDDNLIEFFYIIPLATAATFLVLNKSIGS